MNLPGVIHISGPTAPAAIEHVPEEFLPGTCCYGAVAQGPWFCTCWTPVYDLAQTDELDTLAAPAARTSCCVDCAYRHGSPELGDERAGGLLEITLAPEAGGVWHPFWCHQGMRRVVEWRHPRVEVPLPGGVGDYQPPQVAGRPYRADGRPGLVCAGWLAHVRGGEVPWSSGVS